MPWMTVAWSMTAGACLVMAFVNLLSWFAARSAWDRLFLCLLAAATAALALCELWLLKSQTPTDYAQAVRWFHVPAWVTLVSLVGFVHFHFQAGRPWLGWTVCGLRTLALALNFQSESSINYIEITRLHKVSLFGDSFSVAEGILDPWMVIGQASLVLCVVFIVDATLAVWRRGDRTLALRIGVPLAIAVLGTTLSVLLMFWGGVRWPGVGIAFFVGFILFVTFDLSRRTAQAGLLASRLGQIEHDLQWSEQRMLLAADAAQLGTWEWDLKRDEITLSETGRSLLGLTPDEPLDLERLRRALGHEVDEAFAAAVTRFRSQGGRLDLDHRVVLPGGGERWLHTRGSVDIGGDADGSTRMRGVSFDISDRREARERLAQVMESAPVGLLIIDSLGRIALCNAQIEADFGYLRSEIVGQPLEMLLQEDHRAGPATALPSLHLQADGEVLGLRKDGSRIPLEINLKPLESSRGQEVLAVIANVSDRRQRENALKQERAFLRQVIDINPNLIFVKDQEGRFTLVNQTLADIFGSTVDALVGQKDEDVNPNAAEVARFRQADLEVMRTRKELFIAEEHLTGIAGKEHWLQTVKRPIPGPDGESQLVLGTATDITLRKRIEQALKESEQRFLQVGQIAGEVIWEIDLCGQYIYVSQSVERVLGYAPHELVGRMRLFDLFRPADLTAGASALLQLFSAPQSIRSVRNTRVSKGGRLVQLETSATPVFDRQGDCVGYRGSDTDITRRVEFEQEMAQQRNELAHLSRVSMLSELSGSLAHELNQPLAAILSNAQAALRFLSRDDPDLDEVRDILQDIVTDDKRAGDVIQGLRSLLQKGDLQFEALDLNAVVQEVLRLVRSEMLNAGVALVVQMAPNLPKVQGVKVQLQQVLLNLVMNGCEAMASVSPEDHRLTVYTDTAGDDAVSVIVADRGTGIPEEDLERVFDAFVTTKEQGLGLGLAVCRRIVSAHGGSLWATNNAGRGASFRIALPVGPSEMA